MSAAITPGAVGTTTDLAWRSVLADVLERLRVIVVAGVAVGVLVAGLGSRLAMFLLFLTSPDRVDGVTSDDGFEIGRFTFSGTYNLMVIGAAVGVIGAWAYHAVRPWLIGPHWFRRLTLALAAGVVVGSMLVHADGIDFNLLEPLWFAIGLFVVLPALFAIVIGTAVDRVEKPGSWTATGHRRWVVPLALLLPFPVTLFPVAFIAAGLLLWVPLRRAVLGTNSVPTPVGVFIRGAWLFVAVVGLLSLIGDIQDLV